MNVAVIPARGGSERIPQKNIREFCGKPIMAYSIEMALRSQLFERVIVSTDDNEIAEVAREFGAEIPFVRPSELADDRAGTDAVFIHALKWLQENDRDYEYACCVYPTAPFLKSQLLAKGYELITSNEATSAFTVTTFPSPIFRSLRINEYGRLEMFWPEYREKRSQDLPEAYHDAGQFYWVDIRKYLHETRIWSGDSIPVILPRYNVVDIDTEEDWILAEQLFDSRTENGSKFRH